MTVSWPGVTCHIYHNYNLSFIKSVPELQLCMLLLLYMYAYLVSLDEQSIKIQYNTM